MPTATTKYCQQWTPSKQKFADYLNGIAHLNSRVLLAWMAVESGGSLDAPNGAKFNYLQLKGAGKAGSVGGFASFKSPVEAAGRTYAAIRARKIILQARRKGPAAQIDAIARAWPRGPGTPAAFPIGSYQSAIVAKFNCIEQGDVQGFIDRRDPASEDLVTSWGKGVESIGNRVQDAVGNKFDEMAQAIWPVLLQGALAATGLALIGFALTKMAHKGVGENVQRAAPIAAGVAREAA